MGVYDRRVRAVDYLVVHQHYARRWTGPDGSIALVGRGAFRLKAPASLCYELDLFDAPRFRLEGTVSCPNTAMPTAQLAIKIDGAEIACANFDQKNKGEIALDLGLDGLDGKRVTLGVEFTGPPESQVLISVFEISFSKRISGLAAAALTTPGGGGLLQLATDRHEPDQGVWAQVDGSIRFSELRLYDPSAPASLHAYPSSAMELIRRYRGGLVLDYGSGLPSCHFHNVVTADIVDSPGIDIVLPEDGRLPFADETFDAVLSLAVVEHVPDPFAYAREIHRVLKPGGEVYVDSAFMQHYHGWPHHYFNTTQTGLKTLFRDGFEELGCGVRGYQGATLALLGVLRDWLAALPKGFRAEAEGMPLREFVQELGANPQRNRFSVKLAPSADMLISAGVFFHGKRMEKV